MTATAAVAPDLEQQVRAFAMTRIGFGAAAALAPGFFLRSWLGAAADTPSARLAARMFGGRDVAVGIGLILALRHDAPVRGWLEAAALCDATDAVASVLASRHFPRLRTLAGAASAVGAVAFGRRLVAALPSAPPPA